MVRDQGVGGSNLVSTFLHKITKSWFSVLAKTEHQCKDSQASLADSSETYELGNL